MVANLSLNYAHQYMHESCSISNTIGQAESVRTLPYTIQLAQSRHAVSCTFPPVQPPSITNLLVMLVHVALRVVKGMLRSHCSFQTALDSLFTMDRILSPYVTIVARIFIVPQGSCTD